MKKKWRVLMIIESEQQTAEEVKESILLEVMETILGLYISDEDGTSWEEIEIPK